MPGLERVAEELMGRRKWKLYQDVLLARNLPLPQSDDNDTLSDSAPPEDEEHSHMIATTETIQRHTTAADLVSTEQEGQGHKGLDKSPADHQQVGSPITLDEDSKEDADDTATRQSRDEENKTPPKDESPALAPSVLKIKTIEEINTVAVDAGSNAKEAEGGETILEGLIKRNSSGPPRRPQPADWTPQDKCYFCVDGELVRPAATNATEPASEQPPSPAESESGSSSSRSGTSPPRAQYIRSQQQQAQALVHLLQLQQANFNPSAMNQVQSMPASLAALAALGGSTGLGSLGSSLGFCPPESLLPHWYMNARATNTPDRTPSTTDKSMMATSLSSPSHTEQPLDLSSKSGGQDPDVKIVGESSSTSLDVKPLTSTSPSTLESRLAVLRVPPIDPKQLFKSKARLTAAGGRKTYTEDELQAALRDIQSGRLGTRRAAVLYNIPRSTLRNKVYKLAVEKERGVRPPGPLSAAIDRDDSNDITDDMDDDKDSLMDEDKDDEREIPRPQLSMEDILKYSQMENSGYNDNLKNLLQKQFFHIDSPKRNPAADIWPGIDPNVMGPYIQSILMASGLGQSLPKPEDGVNMMMPEIARFLAEEQHRNILKDQLMKQDHLNNGKPAESSEDDAHKRLYSRQSSTASSVITKNERKTDSPDDVPMEIVEHDAGESRDSPSNVILKIPSFKPLANTPNSGKNGGDTFAGPVTPPLPYFSRSPHPEQTSGVQRHGSPPLGQPKGMFSLRDVIAKSISQKFQQQVPPQNHNDLNQMKVNSQNMDVMESLNAFKRGRLTPPMGSQNISVIKNLASHDLTRNFSSNNNAGNQAQQNNATGGKGTRPKRGKYRNYDRDSLVEAVKAVQRGEMSVHRAGSYYGVPHSTLEYKVKERHLMRPRKRELKNPNPDDKTSTPSASKPGDIPGSGILRTDKSKTAQKPPSKPSFPANSPNGMKMSPMFDPALALGYNPTPFPFWPHAPPFHGMPVEFAQRNPGTSGSFPPNPESFFASQMMQRLQEESARHPGLAQKGNNLLKSARDMAEFYDSAASGGANGSFLEGIIRSSLEQNSQRSRGSEEEGSRRLRTDDVLLAEEMREATRRLRARDAQPATSARPPTPASAAPGSDDNSPPPHPT